VDKPILRLGYYKQSGELVKYAGDGHIVLVAPTRSGKGRDLLVPALLTYPARADGTPATGRHENMRGSCLVIDPKGQLCAVTRKQREKFGRVVVLNPYNILPNELGPSVGYNPMDTLDPSSIGFAADCDSLAEAIITYDGKGESHWPDSARQLVSGVIMRLASDPSYANRRNLAFMRDRVTKNPYRFAAEVCALAETAEREGRMLDDTVSLAHERLARFGAPDAHLNKEINGIISTANTQTAFLGVRAIAGSVSRSDFRFRDMKREPMTVYLVLPTRYLVTSAKWFRLVLASALTELLQEPEEDEDVPVLAVIDECYQLGTLNILRDAMSLAAGYGLQLLCVFQDLNQIRERYGETFQTFLANSDVQLYFAPRETTSAEYLSKLSGEEEVRVRSESLREISQQEAQGGYSGINLSWSRITKPLLRPHEVMMVPGDEFLMFADGKMSRFRRQDYRKTPDLEGLYNPDPYHRARRPRR
jgi:type IV secretion system protein VirD4